MTKEVIFGTVNRVAEAGSNIPMFASPTRRHARKCPHATTHDADQNDNIREPPTAEIPWQSSAFH